MIVRYVLAILIMLAGVVSATRVQAEPIKAFVHNVVRDFKRNNCWPKPFLRPDRHAVWAPFAVMVNNGWRRQNMLADHHFEEGATALTAAGQLRIRWIMVEAPPQHRTIYVHRAETSELTDMRRQAVREYAMQFAAKGQVPLVLETRIDAQGWPASRVDAISRSWEESTPEPRLPSDTAGGGGGGSGGD